MLHIKRWTVVPQNTWIIMAPLKHVLGSNPHFFHLEGPLLFSGVRINQLRNLFIGIKVGVTHQKLGIWPQTYDQNTILLRNAFKKTFLAKDRWLKSQTPICKSFLLQYWREFSVFRTCFQGQWKHYGRTVGRTDGRSDRRTEEQTDRPTDQPMYRLTNEHTLL